MFMLPCLHTLRLLSKSEANNVPDNLCADIQREMTPISVIHLLYMINMDS